MTVTYQWVEDGESPYTGSQTEDSSSFESAPHFGELHVGSCKPPESGNLEELISNWCKHKIKVNMISILKLETVTESSQSFNLKFVLDESDKCLNADILTKGVIVRKFFRPKRNSNTDNNNAG